MCIHDGCTCNSCCCNKTGCWLSFSPVSSWAKRLSWSVPIPVLPALRHIKCWSYPVENKSELDRILIKTQQVIRPIYRLFFVKWTVHYPGSFAPSSNSELHLLSHGHQASPQFDPTFYLHVWSDPEYPLSLKGGDWFVKSNTALRFIFVISKTEWTLLETVLDKTFLLKGMLKLLRLLHDIPQQMFALLPFISFFLFMVDQRFNEWTANLKDLVLGL